MVTFNIHITKILKLILILLFLILIIWILFSWHRLNNELEDSQIRLALTQLRAYITTQYIQTIDSGEPQWPKKLSVDCIKSLEFSRSFQKNSEQIRYVNHKIRPNDFTDLGGWVYSTVDGDIRANFPNKHQF